MVHETRDDGAELRQALVDDLKRRNCVRSMPIESAFLQTPRHLFMPGVSLAEVYSDRAIAVKRDCTGQWLSSSSQPAIMAIMLEQLGLEPGRSVLEIGAGTGYNAALMAYIVGPAGQITTVDIDKHLVAAAREHLEAMGLNRVQVVWADGGYGYPDSAPYDRIVLSVGADDILPAWLEQIRPGGRLVVPLTVTRGMQLAIAFQRVGDHLESLSVHDCGFMMLRGAFAATPQSRLQIGLEPGLELDAIAEQPLDTDRLYLWLIGDTQDWETGVEVSTGELMSSLMLWLILREPDGRALVAVGDMAERGIVPALIALRGERQSSVTSVWIGEQGGAALMRASTSTALSGQVHGSSGMNARFPLAVRQFGASDSMAQRLVGLVRAWEDAGRPGSPEMLVRAYPRNVEYHPREGEFVVEKDWTRLVLQWPADS